MYTSRSKYNYLQSLSNDGVISAIAIDQRGSLKKMISAASGKEPDQKEIEDFKKVISTELTPYASAILTDPQYGLPAAKDRAKNAGLLLAYEKTGYDTTEPGRMCDLLSHWSAKRIKEAGADAVKFMLYYDVDEPKEINDKKQAFVERIGDECKAEGISFFLELMSYDANIADNKSKEYAKVKPHKVNDMIREFAKRRYNVDVLKVEVPVNMAYVEGFGDDPVYTQDEAKKYFRDQNLATDGLPFIFLSAGVSAQMFQDTLKFAHKAGSTFNGVLCGRATWRHGVEPYATEGENAERKWMDNEGRKNIEELNDVLQHTATSWKEKVEI